jgi:uncharacterized protein
VAPVVSNSSPLILLSGIGQLPQLEALFGQVTVADAVYTEVVIRGTGRPGSAEVRGSAFIHRAPPEDERTLDDFMGRTGLGAGEAATILLAMRLNPDLVIIDERAARIAAKAAGLRIAGTLRVLELAYERGLISDLGAAYSGLQESGARISPLLLEESLRRHGLPPLP